MINTKKYGTLYLKDITVDELIKFMSTTDINKAIDQLCQKGLVYKDLHFTNPLTQY